MADNLTPVGFFSVENCFQHVPLCLRATTLFPEAKSLYLGEIQAWKQTPPDSGGLGQHLLNAPRDF